MKRRQTQPPSWQEIWVAAFCNNTVALWNEDDRVAAKSYVEGSGQPTKECPDPITDIEVICDPGVKTGEYVDGSYIIRYAYDGAPVGGCNQDAETAP